MTAPATPVLCVITRGRSSRNRPDRCVLLDRLAAAASAGATMIQVRERQFDDRQLFEFVGQVVEAVRPAGALVLVNERTDIALAAGADGVHLKSNSPPVEQVRRIVPERFVIGRSVHSDVEAAAVDRAGGCDYLLFGTVFPSASKPANHPIAGVEALKIACQRVQLPVIAIGGITPARAASILDAGAAGAAGISVFADAPDMGAAVRALRAALTLPAHR